MQGAIAGSLIIAAAALVLAAPPTLGKPPYISIPFSESPLPILPSEASFEASAATVTLRLRFALQDDDAMEFRQALDRVGDADRIVDAAEIQAYEESIGANAALPDCMPPSGLLRLDGQSPLRLESMSVKTKGAAGLIYGGPPISMDLSKTFRFPPAAPEGFRLELNRSSADWTQWSSRCWTPPEASTIWAQDTGDPWRHAVFLIFAQSGFTIEPDGIAPEELASSHRLGTLAFLSRDAPAGPITVPFTAKQAAAEGRSVATPGATNGPGFLIGAGLILALATFPAASRRVRVLAAVLALRLRRGGALEHDGRQEIYDVIEARPGITPADLARQLALSEGALSHHLAVLVRFGLIKAVRDGPRSRYHARGPRIDLTPFLTDGQRSFLDLVRKRPGVTVMEAQQALGLAPTTVRHHISRLRRAGHIHVDGSSRSLRCFPVAPATG